MELRLSTPLVNTHRRPAASQQATSQPAEEKCEAERDFQVLIADRDSMSGDLLATTLVRDKKFHAAAVLSGDLIRILATRHVDLVVIAADLNYQLHNGFELAAAVGRAQPKVRTILLLTTPTRSGVIQAFRSGARGVLSREQPISEFLECVEHVRRGYIWVGHQEAIFLLQVLANLPAPALLNGMDEALLSDRELQVVQSAAMGKTNKAIALELRLSEHTVKNYMFRAFEKLGVSSRVELLFYLTVKGHSFPTVVADPGAVEEVECA
ncbi:MAG TPA: response regulator transcription factor [Acidobacteriaceae bacterium]|jgi:DNA-binding NarL/FixJ family response regulator|nr:response regulator transcription factor [Acidobacteriaceae bacterium]